MQKEFNKYQGAGNDFIIIDNRDRSIATDNEKLIQGLCDRHFGIGADGLILIIDHDMHAFEMLYFNSDGKLGTMCGNGGRCAYAFALDSGIVNGECSFVASDGAHTAKLTSDAEVQLGMNDVSKPIKISGNHFLNTGSPHYIIPVPNIDKIDVDERGRAIRWNDSFAPEGTNVNFIEIEKYFIKVRTFERGVEAETLSCGTGITAAAISSKWNDSEGEKEVIVETIGGSLKVNFTLSKERATKVFLSGPAEKVFTGTINTENYL